MTMVWVTALAILAGTAMPETGLMTKAMAETTHGAIWPVACNQVAEPAAAGETRMTIISAAALVKDATQTDRIRDEFAGLGFDAQTISPGVLLLTGDSALFEKTFGSDVTVDDTGAHVTAQGSPTRAAAPRDSSRSLPLGSLPPQLHGQLTEVEFETPPEFGPTNF